jgi:hypothetical protein
MKKISILMVLAVAMAFASCEKADDMPVVERERTEIEADAPKEAGTEIKGEKDMSDELPETGSVEIKKEEQENKSEVQQ